MLHDLAAINVGVHGTLYLKPFYVWAKQCDFVKGTKSSKIIANEVADPTGLAVDLANHRAVPEYMRKLSSQRAGPFDHIWV